MRRLRNMKNKRTYYVFSSNESFQYFNRTVQSSLTYTYTTSMYLNTPIRRWILTNSELLLKRALFLFYLKLEQWKLYPLSASPVLPAEIRARIFFICRVYLGKSIIRIFFWLGWFIHSQCIMFSFIRFSVFLSCSCKNIFVFFSPASNWTFLWVFGEWWAFLCVWLYPILTYLAYPVQSTDPFIVILLKCVIHKFKYKRYIFRMLAIIFLRILNSKFMQVEGWILLELGNRN